MRDQRLLCVANLARIGTGGRARSRQFHGSVPIELMGSSAFPPIGELPTADVAGLRLLLVPAREEAQQPLWHVATPEPLPDFITLVMRDGSTSALRSAIASDRALTRCRQFLRGSAGSVARKRHGGLAFMPSARFDRRRAHHLLNDRRHIRRRAEQRYFLPFCPLGRREPASRRAELSSPSPRSGEGPRMAQSRRRASTSVRAIVRCASSAEPST